MNTHQKKNKTRSEIPSTVADFKLLGIIKKCKVLLLFTTSFKCNCDNIHLDQSIMTIRYGN